MGEIRVLKMMVADVLTQFISSNDIKLDNDDFKKYTKHITSDVKNKYVITKKKKEKPQLIDKNEICVARKTNNLQCTRQKVISTEFCKAQIKSCLMEDLMNLLRRKYLLNVVGNARLKLTLYRKIWII